MCLDSAFLTTCQNEGGFSDDPKDPGNWTGGKVGVGILKGTKYGISAASFPELDIINLTLEDAHEIYRRRYWLPLQCPAIDQTLPLLADLLFDLGVNCGIGNAGKFLQRAINTLIDTEGLPIEQRRRSPWREAIAKRLNAKTLLVDGVVGPITIEIFIKIPYPKAVLSGVFGEAYIHYSKLSSLYRPGWLKRLGGWFREVRQKGDLK